MRHARDCDLDRLEDLLVQLRTLPGLKEKSRGCFYRNSRGFLHFHEDPRGLFADIGGAPSGGFDRIEVTDEPGRNALLTAVRQRLNG